MPGMPSAMVGQSWTKWPPMPQRWQTYVGPGVANDALPCCAAADARFPAAMDSIN